MATSKVIFETDVPSRYINRLCRHWSHKFEVTFDDTQGDINLGESRCRLSAAPNALHVSLEAAEDSIERLQQVVVDHLQRFAPKGVELHGAWERVPG